MEDKDITTEWLASIHREILKTQKMILDLHELYAKTEKTKAEIKSLKQ